ncbi:winged helix-turn-helix transcriptional regulator [Methanotorris igneus]|uniref:Transcriptional regulator, ArsR family n=1 Tax=Methanotorris igneus (strain DSM 5666 / JCM 11834 / Kol 5) TaxID=880724 RepID=F6BEP1_METIK|nr:winged helix-turn-helix transcriptional regulator [Methanotorris igneus]AEF96838.1 transcriptional regulator, ArsR family [Methanotorris igneus Kol 5]
MKLIIIFIYLILLLSNIMSIYGIDKFYDIREITKMSYNTTLFLEYDKEHNPIFYVNTPKDYYIAPVKINVIGVNRSLLNDMGFILDKDDYDVLISNRTVETNKNAILFIPINGSTNLNRETATLINWKIDPLNYKSSVVIAKYKLPKKGEIIAVYSDGSPACIKLNNKIYCGFKPNKEVLYNLIYIFMIKNAKNIVNIPYGLIFGTLFLGIISYLSITSQRIKEIILKSGAYLIIITGRVSINNKEKVLLNDTRKEIYNYIVNNPGVHLREIAKNLNKSVSTIIWHLRILEKANLIRSKKVGNKRIYYPKGMDVRDLQLIYLNNKLSKKIYEYLLKNPAHLRKISRDLDIPVETVRYNLRKMEELGIVDSYEEGNKIIYTVNSKL